MISSFIESRASFFISDSRKEFCIVVSLKEIRLLASVLLMNPVDKKNNSSHLRMFNSNLSIIFVSNAEQKYRVKNN